MSFTSKPDSFWGNSKLGEPEKVATTDESASLWSQVTSLQDSMITQLQGFSESLPEVGPLSESFRKRLVNAVYLLLGACFFGVLTVVIGIPTIVIRPSKFVICITLTTLLAASSVIVIQKPSVFFSKMLSGGVMNALPFICLIVTELVTLYVTIFIHKYVAILAAAAIQVLALLYYLSSFIPGGTAGLSLILRVSFTIVSTLAKPLIMMATQCIRTIFNS
jgi:hypothetical protein